MINYDLTPYLHNSKPVANITPFTYRDGVTYVELLTHLRKYITGTLTQDVQTLMVNLAKNWTDENAQLVKYYIDNVEGLVALVNEELEKQTENNDTNSAALTQFVDTSVTTLKQTVNTQVGDLSIALKQATDAIAKTAGPGSSGILLPGDSLTEAMSYGTNSAALVAAFGASKIKNLGIGGQGTDQIAARQGGTPAMLGVAGNTIPVSGEVVVTPDVNLLGFNGTSGTASIKGVLSGVPGTLKLTKRSNTDYTYTFTRSFTGLSVVVGALTPFITSYGYATMPQIICAGRNGFTIKQPADEIALIRSMIAISSLPSSMHLVAAVPPDVTETPGTVARGKLDALNLAIRKAFPLNYVDVPGYLRSEATLLSVGITPTTQDKLDIANGVTPQSFRNDGLHYNPAAYKAIGQLYVRELGSRGVTAATSTVIPDTTPPVIDPPTTVAAHSYGLTNASHRYVGVDLPYIDNNPVIEWKDRIGTMHLTAPGASVLISKAGPGGVDRRFVTPNVDPGAANRQQLSVPNGEGDVNIRTIAVLYNNQTPAALSYILAAQTATGGVKFNRGSTGQFVASAGNNFTVQNAPAAGWYLAFVSYDAVAGKVYLDSGTGATIATATVTAPTFTSTGFTIGGPEANILDMSIAEVITWNTVLSDSDKAAVKAALKARFPVLI